MELTREQAIEEHRKMWRWLAENPTKYKRDYVLEESNGNGINTEGMINYWSLCTYAAFDCEACPLDWDGGCCYSFREDEDSLYDKWIFYGEIHNYNERAKIARQIAELPAKISIPEKITDVTYTDDNTSELDYAAGWNACIDAMTGGDSK